MDVEDFSPFLHFGSSNKYMYALRVYHRTMMGTGTNQWIAIEQLSQERLCEACRATFAFCFDSEPPTKPDPN